MLGAIPLVAQCVPLESSIRLVSHEEVSISLKLRKDPIGHEDLQLSWSHMSISWTAQLPNKLVSMQILLETRTARSSTIGETEHSLLCRSYFEQSPEQ